MIEELRHKMDRDCPIMNIVEITGRNTTYLDARIPATSALLTADRRRVKYTSGDSSLLSGLGIADL